MCFSATGSFVGAGILAGIGFVAFSRNASTRHRMYAAIPLLFAIQQAAEGVVWLTMHHHGASWLQPLAIDIFLIFALVIWPLWMPWALLRIEHDTERRRLLAGLLCVGVAVAACAAVAVFIWQPVAQVAGHSIRYVYAHGSASIRPFFVLTIYAIPTIAPFFVSSVSLARVTGAALVVSLAAAVFIELNVLTSVWCFFASVLSGLVLAAIILERRLPPPFLARLKL